MVSAIQKNQGKGWEEVVFDKVKRKSHYDKLIFEQRPKEMKE